MMEYYSAIKRNEVLIYATMWMKLRNIMLSERSQTQTRQYYAIYTILHNLTYTWNLRKKTVKFTETE